MNELVIEVNFIARKFKCVNSSPLPSKSSKMTLIVVEGGFPVVYVLKNLHCVEGRKLVCTNYSKNNAFYGWYSSLMKDDIPPFEKVVSSFVGKHKVYAYFGFDKIRALSKGELISIKSNSVFSGINSQRRISFPYDFHNHENAFVLFG